MDATSNDNASRRESYVGAIYDVGSDAVKAKVLSELKPEWSELHRSGRIHIHDLEAYDLTYNCLTFDLLGSFPYGDVTRGGTPQRTVLNIFMYIWDIIVKTGNEQSGGMAFANFDSDLSRILAETGCDGCDYSIVDDSIDQLIRKLSGSHERYGQVSYYVTLNIGLGTDETSRRVCRSVLENFRDAGPNVIKPNIVFKVKRGVNMEPGDANHDLYLLALGVTSRKMIPTYLLCDCPLDRDADPKELSVMGCRTRVVSNVFGGASSIGRGNICNVTINLPRLALESMGCEDPMGEFVRRWDRVASEVKDILLDRYGRLTSSDAGNFPTILEHRLWIGDPGKGMGDVFRNGTLAIGFIGLSDTFQVLFGEPYYASDELYGLALGFVEHMRAYTDSLTEKFGLNFSLLATAGEMISGRFPEIDSLYFDHEILRKGYYTNSFHVRVDDGMSPFRKIAVEGPFHTFCNGGCITYVELESSPVGNEEALDEMIGAAVDAGVHYMGFNFALDICNGCGCTGIFDKCVRCGSESIKRIRRVSGYLEELGYFTDGKKNEVKARRVNGGS